MDNNNRNLSQLDQEQPGTLRLREPEVQMIPKGHFSRCSPEILLPAKEEAVFVSNQRGENYLTGFKQGSNCLLGVGKVRLGKPFTQICFLCPAEVQELLMQLDEKFQ